MKLEDLKLNRFLYKDTKQYDPLSALDAAANNASLGSSDDQTIVYPPATAVAEGTVIQNSIWQSSGSDQRIEILPSDELNSYRNGVRITRLNRNGIRIYNTAGDAITTISGSGTDVIFSEDNADTGYEFQVDGSGTFSVTRNGDVYMTIGDIASVLPGVYFNLNNAPVYFNGTPQPVAFTGKVNAAGTAGSVFPSLWSVVNLSAGRYQITHNLNTLDYVVNITAVSATTKELSVEAQNVNDFIVRIYDNAAATLINTDFAFYVGETV